MNDPDRIRNTIVNRLKQIMKDNNWSRNHLAKLCGIGSSTLGSIISNGKIQSLNVQSIVRITDTLG